MGNFSLAIAMQFLEIIAFPSPGKNCNPTIRCSDKICRQKIVKIFRVFNFRQFFRSCCITRVRHATHRNLYGNAITFRNCILLRVKKLNSESLLSVWELKKSNIIALSFPQMSSIRLKGLTEIAKNIYASIGKATFQNVSKHFNTPGKLRITHLVEMLYFMNFLIIRVQLDYDL